MGSATTSTVSANRFENVSLVTFLGSNEHPAALSFCEICRASGDVVDLPLIDSFDCERGSSTALLFDF
jgi:hypothetical protein